MLSSNCYGCRNYKQCGRQFSQVDGRKDKFIFCPIDGSRMLVDT